MSAKPSINPQLNPQLKDSAAVASDFAKYPNALQEAVAFTFHVKFGAWAGKLGNFLSGKVGEKSRNSKWDEFKITDPPMTPEEIAGFGLWYRALDKFEGQEAPPTTPETLADRVLEFRGSTRYHTAMKHGQEKMRKLLNIPDEEPEEEYVDPQIVEDMIQNFRKNYRALHEKNERERLGLSS